MANEKKSKNFKFNKNDFKKIGVCEKSKAISNLVFIEAESYIFPKQKPYFIR